MPDDKCSCIYVDIGLRTWQQRSAQALSRLPGKSNKDIYDAAATSIPARVVIDRTPFFIGSDARNDVVLEDGFSAAPFSVRFDVLPGSADMEGTIS